MFAGHYGPAFAIKAQDRSIPLWALFLAVQIVDVFWAIFVLLGIEHARIVPGFTRTNALDLYDMPFTHSLPGTLAWAVAALVGYRLLRRGARWAPAVLVAVAVASHWALDLIAHRPDLALWDDAWKVGFGLWDYPLANLALEAALVFGGTALYLRATGGAGRGAAGFWIFGVVMLAAQGAMLFSPPPPSPEAVAAMALVSYALFAAAAWWLERRRESRRG